MPDSEEPVPLTEGEAVPAGRGGRKEKRFRYIEDLWSALEEYGAFHDGTLVRRYEPRMPSGGVRTGGEVDATQERIMRQNQAINRAMYRMAVVAPKQHRLLDAFYRRPGPSGAPAACHEAKGWLEAAKRAGYLGGPMEMSRATFDVVIEDAVAVLWYCHRVKPRRST